MKINIVGLKKSYFLDGHEVPVLKGIDLQINSGDFISLTGPSGVGKSTLLHIMGTLDMATAGTIELGEQDIKLLSQAQVADFRNRNIGFMFQFHHLLPEFQALENVMMPLLIRRENRAKAESKAKDLLARVGLSERMRHRPGELSGGEQQRVALARALVSEPQILLADEPTGNLDEETGAGIFNILKQMNKEQGITTVIVTHNPRLAQEANRQFALGASTLVELVNR